MVNPVHLFLLIPNNSGSTWLQDNLSQCRNCVAFDRGLDGKGVMIGTHAYPDQEINNLFSEKKEMWANPEEYSWELIKLLWDKAWSDSPHYETADPRVYLEKTPQAIYASDMYVENFENVHFIISIRNPYAVIEGIRRRVEGDVDIKRCAEHWFACAQQQVDNIKKYKDRSVVMNYETLVEFPHQVERWIRDSIPGLDDVDFTKAAASHSMDGNTVAPPTDFNERQIKNLSAEDIQSINQVLRQDTKMLTYFGYEIIE